MMGMACALISKFFALRLSGNNVWPVKPKCGGRLLPIRRIAEKRLRSDLASDAVAGTDNRDIVDSVDCDARVVRYGISQRPDILALVVRSEEHTSELQSLRHLVCRL